MGLEFRPTSDQAIAELRTEYLTLLQRPLDGMWESLTGQTRPVELLRDGVRVGYYSMNPEGVVLQFFLVRDERRRAIEYFSALFERSDVRGAMASTADPRFLVLCLDRQRTARVHTLLYEMGFGSGREADRQLDLSMDLVEATEIPAVVGLQRASLDADLGDWLVGYVENLVSRRELFAFRFEGEVQATGELRVSDSQKPHADLGVITMRPYRGRGVAGRVLRTLAERCQSRGLVPLCSTTVENIASQRAIASAGFVATHRWVEFEF